MGNAAPWIFVALAGLVTWVSPLLSLYLFVLASPFGAVDVLGWDPRTRWAILLCLRGAWEAWRTGTSLVPRTAYRVWAGFTVLAVGGLWIGNTGLVPDELEASRSLLLYFVAGSCGVYGIWQLVRSKQQLRTLSAVFATSVLMASAIGVVQAHVRYRLSVPSDRISGSLGNANYVATYLALAATPLVLLVRRDLLKRWYGCIACAAAVVACGLTLSRTGTMAILVGVGLALVVRSDTKLASARIIAAAAAAALLGGVLLASYLLEYRRSVINSDDPQREQLVEDIQAVEDLSRLEAFRYSVQLTAEHPLAGIGFGSFQARNYDANGLYVTTHNTVMEVLVGTGLPGGILILSLIFSLVRPLHLHARRHLFPAAAAFGICCLFGDYLQSIEVFVVFAVLYLSVRNLIPDPPATSNEPRQPCVV
jgi:O-antigen ligase